MVKFLVTLITALTLVQAASVKVRKIRSCGITSDGTTVCCDAVDSQLCLKGPLAGTSVIDNKTKIRPARCGSVADGQAGVCCDINDTCSRILGRKIQSCAKTGDGLEICATGKDPAEFGKFLGGLTFIDSATKIRPSDCSKFNQDSLLVCCSKGNACKKLLGLPVKGKA